MTELEKKELPPLVTSPAINRKLLRNARRPIVEIAAETGIPPEEVAERLHDLLHATTWRDDLIEEKLLLHDLAELLDTLRSKMSKSFVEDEAWASMARVQLATVKVMLEQLDKRRKAVDADLVKISKEQAAMFVAAFETAQELTVRRIEQEHPEWDAEVIRTTFAEVLPAAVQIVEKNTHD